MASELSEDTNKDPKFSLNKTDLEHSDATTFTITTNLVQFVTENVQ